MATAGYRAAPLAGLGLTPVPTGLIAPGDYRLHPHYRAKSPLEEVFRKVQPGLDAFLTERYAEEMESLLNQWSAGLRKTPPDFEPIAGSLSPGFMGSSWRPSETVRLRSDMGVEILRRRFSSEGGLNRTSFLRDLSSVINQMPPLITAEFKVFEITASSSSATVIQTRVRSDLVGEGTSREAEAFREERIGIWELEWEWSDSSLKLRKWQALGETQSRITGPGFIDVTSSALGKNPSYTEQMLHGTDHWRAVLDAACGIDVYGNNGIAAGDIDNDSFDDLYVCQPAGLPNRLYRNRRDGTFEDATESAGVGVLDSTACALFADFDNDGYQDLLVVRSAGPLLFLNQRNGRFRLKKDAFRFAQSPQGTFTGAAAADYDRDGHLDVYLCLYSYYQGLDQYRFPTPYHDAQNGPPNFLFHNNGDATFDDVTDRTSMNQNNNRFSFACAWCDYNNDQWPDLYVANDFGRKNLYRNNGDGTFTDVASEASVADVGAGMSVCWFDYNHDGNQDLYVGDMWSAAGLRVAMQDAFMKDAPANVRALYRKHASGNSLFHNEGNGRFSDRTHQAGVDVGRWAWSADSWDFDHDGYPDLYVANGFISGPNRKDLESFFWRQVVSHSPLEARASRDYEQGWSAVNELIRADSSWNGYERNNFLVNNRDGTFSEIAGSLSLDFPDDSRAYALADFDHDGRLEIALKNRNAPQLRLLRNEMQDLGDAIALRLRGRKSNRDAIGATVTIETETGRQSKFLQAGSGFLSQHTKELFFGLGKPLPSSPLPPGKGLGLKVRATVRWPSGLVQQFESLPFNHRIQLEEGSDRITAAPFQARTQNSKIPPVVGAIRESPLPAPTSETWLIGPLPAPEFSLPDIEGRVHALSQFRGHPVLLNFWSTWSPYCAKELKLFQQKRSMWEARGLRLLAINANEPSDLNAVQAFVRDAGVAVPVLLANEDVLGIYNLLYRYLFDRRRDLGIPTSFLLDRDGLITKVYQGPMNPDQIEQDLSSIPRTEEERTKKALPFAGQFYGGRFRRNHFTYGVAFFQKGYVDQALASFRLVVDENPDYAEAHYNLGTLYSAKHMPVDARRHLERALELRPRYPDALNNLGLLAAEAGRTEDARHHFERAIVQDPNYAIALQNFGNLLRREGRLAEAEELLERALRSDPEDPEVSYSLAMLFAQKDDKERAREYFQKALKLRPDYPEALNNLGVLYLRTRKLEEAAASFQACIRVSPDFDQPYLNLSKLYVATGEARKAEQTLRQLLGRLPDHKLARQALAELTR